MSRFLGTVFLHFMLPPTAFIVLERRQINCWSPSGSEKALISSATYTRGFPLKLSLSRVSVSPAVFLSWSSPDVVHLWKRFSSPLPRLPPVSQNVFGLARPVWLDWREKGSAGGLFKHLTPGELRKIDWRHIILRHTVNHARPDSLDYTCVHPVTCSSFMSGRK